MGHQFEELSGRILGAAMEVALDHREIRFPRQQEVHVYFEEVDLGVHRLDLVVEEQAIVELKAVKCLEDILSDKGVRKSLTFFAQRSVTSTPPL